MRSGENRAEIALEALEQVLDNFLFDFKVHFRSQFGLGIVLLPTETAFSLQKVVLLSMPTLEMYDMI